VPLPVLEPLPMLPVPVLPAPVLPALGTEPEDDPGAVGDVVVVPEDVLPLAPAPALEPCSRRQSSRCVPVRPTHWLGVAVVDAPLAAEPLVLVSLEPLVVDPLVLEPAPAEPEGKVADEPVELEPDASVAPVEPDAPVPPANDAEDRARSAAAVAAVIVFNII
jgi:hypothetical protein